GTIDSSEREMIQNVFEFDDITAGDILTHRTQVDMLYLEESDEEWDTLIRESRHSHYPVCDETADNVVGILDARDYFRLPDRSRESVMKKAVSPARFVPDSVSADALFFDMKKSRNHFAVVLDEYGGMSGIVTMNDLLEEIVGDLYEEDDEEPPLMEQLDARTWRMDGTVPLEDIAETLHVHIPEEDYDTLNGLVLSQLRSVPDDGARFTVHAAGLIIAVEEVKNHRVHRALVRSAPKEKPSG
ncbi:MAG: hemolysin family protein, partial [Clostridia bacterium]|nr:hemolysin family protein [Clostridia bacterium]